jgi:excisionase family DNA binding protein
VLTLTQAAISLGVSKPALQQAIKRGSLQARKIGHLWVLDTAEVERYRRDNLGRFGNRSARRD